MIRATGIGGVFFKSKNVATLKDWYRDNLGFKVDEWGASMVWGDPDPNNNHVCYTAWSPFKNDTDYYAPSTLPYMINYRVGDLKHLIDVLRSENVNVVGGIDSYDYGHFAWIMDPEGRKIELWEPIDAGFGDPPPIWANRVTGIGGIFFKSNDPAAMKAWYKKHLDIEERFLLRDLASNKQAYIDWAPVANNDQLFSETDRPYVFGYRVRDLGNVMSDLEKKDLKTSNSKTAWVIDPEGNKVILRES